MRCIRPVYACLILVGIFVDGGFAQSTRQPGSTTRPVNVDARSLQIVLRELGVGDSTAREEALSKLLTLRRADLPALRDAVADARPLAPGTIAVLQEVVTHVYLREEPYEAHADKSFLGVQMWPIDLYFLAQGGEVFPPVPFINPGRLVLDDKVPDAPRPIALRAGVIISVRMPGFCGYGALRDGDVVLALPELGFEQLNSSQDLSIGVQSAAPGRKITVRVLRRGRELDIPVVLDPRPVAADRVNAGAFDLLVQQRAELAEKYWQEHFAVVVDDVL